MLVWNQDPVNLLASLGHCLDETRHFLRGIMQLDPFNYFYVPCSNWSMIPGLATVRTPPHRIMMRWICPPSSVHCGMNSVFEGHLTNWLRPLRSRSFAQSLLLELFTIHSNDSFPFSPLSFSLFYLFSPLQSRAPRFKVITFNYFEQPNMWFLH